MLPRTRLPHLVLLARAVSRSAHATSAPGPTPPPADGSGDCDLGGILSSFAGECNYRNFVDHLADGCRPASLFPDGDGEAAIAEACEYSATAFVEIQGTYQLDRRYFAGGGPMVDGEEWPIDTARVQRFENNMASNTVIGFPEYTARMEYNQNNGHGYNGYPTNLNLETSCELQTAMCCFTEGNFAADSVLETGVCRHDLHDSPQSNHIKNGWSIFPNDEGAETPTNSNAAHCVGFTWQDDTELLGNMMYDVSLRNSINKGYLQGIPGGPMCGCVEHMPVVEQAACRTANKVAGTETYSFYFAPAYDGDDGYVYATQLAVIEYTDCAAGDLKAQYAANHADDAAAAALIDEHLVGTGGCADAVSEYLNEEHFLVQHNDDSRFNLPDPAMWSDQVVGEGIYFLPADIDYSGADADFRALVNAGCTNADGSSRACIVRRTCPSCYESHRDIYYQRLTALPTTYNFLDLFMNNWVSSENIVNMDFALYSSFDDAIAGTGAWTYCNYNDSGIGFPRDCGPTGHVGWNWNSYTRSGGDANHHAFWVEKP